jgi:hypothetical protein
VEQRELIIDERVGHILSSQLETNFIGDRRLADANWAGEQQNPDRPMIAGANSGSESDTPRLRECLSQADEHGEVGVKLDLDHFVRAHATGGAAPGCDHRSSHGGGAMKGDFSRLSFDEGKSYTAVLMQQGRVQVDSDWNEHAAIGAYLDRTRFVDIVGEAVVPNGVGFDVHPGASGGLALSPGRIYAGGLICELATETPISLVARRALRPNPGRTDLVYLDVWERTVTALDDPDLLDPALGGSDTSVRLKGTWVIDVVEDVGDRSCAEARAALPNLGLSRLSAEAPGGYAGVDNRLYRVEIHDGGALGEATFKWSRDNGSLVFPLHRFVNGNTALLGEAAADPRMTVGDWFEVSSDDRERLGLAGTLARLEKWFQEAREVTFDRDLSTHAEEARPRARRWDQTGAATMPVTDAWTELESGVRIRFSGRDFRTGDYWTFPARPGAKTVNWPAESPPQGIRHELCPLAFVTWGRSSEGLSCECRDCRPVIAPLTAMYAELLRLREELADLRSVLDRPKPRRQAGSPGQSQKSP